MFEPGLLYPVLDVQVSRSGDCEQDFINACKSGIKMIQLRAKKYSQEKLKECAKRAREITREFGVKLIINDWPDIAKLIDADGVHVGQKDQAIDKARGLLGANKIIGGSAETLADAKKVEEAGADYVGVGSIFPSATKKDIKVIGLKDLKEISEKVKIPVVAIGGINSSNFTRVIDTGVRTVSVISDIFMAEDVAKKIKEYQERYKEHARGIDY